MANDLTTTTPWTPPQTKYVRWTVTGIIGFLLLIGASLTVTHFVPTVVDAVDLLTKLTGSLINLSLTGAGLLVVMIFLHSVFSKNGGINKLFSQASDSFFRNLTYAVTTIDPITPLTQMRDEAIKRKAVFDASFARFDGGISHLKETESRFTADANEAEARAKAAQSKIATDPRMKNAFESFAYTAGECRKSAARFHAMQDRLIPVRATIVRLQDAAEVMINNLDTDIRIKEAEWSASKDMDGMGRAARDIMSGSDRKQLANIAQNLIETKYAQQMGQLDNLSTTSQKFLDTMDLDKATYSEELLTSWQQDSTKLIAAPPSSSASSAGFRSLLTN